MQKNLSILLQFSVPALEFCRSFPQDLVYARREVFGLGIPHFYTIQEILRIKDMIKHNFLQSITCQLYTASLEYLHLE
jgi:hypothetical protein